ncbi:NUDIX domain-containing protein [Streptomyces sp. Ncost-T10-10d]|uniref:NUDIX hydrolase n=1 Tax=Streptomyces sp. Ncost-T10-10d TaxID=1839774 RepID=UPI000B869892|nr:NUDIX domain-containing protein [Streptomyces sp. Ncost-T10-10d]
MTVTTPNSSHQGGNSLNVSSSAQPQSTAVLLVNSHGKYLLHLRDAHKPICDPGTWSLVGGGPEPGETLDEAIAREILEETGLVLPHVAPYTTARAHGPNVTAGNIQVYTARWDGVAHDLPVSEGIMFAWFDVATMEQLSMCPWAHKVIKAHHAEHPAPQVPGPRDGAGQGGAGAVKNVIGAHLFLKRENCTLLGLRHASTAFAGGEWHALAGRVERESVRSCLVREAYEEAGIAIEPADLSLVHTVHLLDDHENAEPRLQLFFQASRWDGEPKVREPDRCTAWQWWPLDALPDPVVPYIRAAIEGILAGTAYTELGWESAAPAPDGR